MRMEPLKTLKTRKGTNNSVYSVVKAMGVMA